MSRTRNVTSMVLSIMKIITNDHRETVNNSPTGALLRAFTNKIRLEIEKLVTFKDTSWVNLKEVLVFTWMTNLFHF